MSLLQQSVKIPPISGPCCLGGWLRVAVGVTRGLERQKSVPGVPPSLDGANHGTLRRQLSGRGREWLMRKRWPIKYVCFQLYTSWRFWSVFFKCRSWMYDLLTYICFIWSIYSNLWYMYICIIFIIPSIPQHSNNLTIWTQKGPTKVCFQHSFFSHSTVRHTSHSFSISEYAKSAKSSWKSVRWRQSIRIDSKKVWMMRRGVFEGKRWTVQ